MSDDPDSNSATIDVTILDPAWAEAFSDAETLVREAVAATLAEAGRKPSPQARFEVSVALADDARVRQLNCRFRDMDAPTNVLAFAGPDMPSAAPAEHEQLLGDVILARQTVLREAAEQGKSAAHHTAHLIVHGVLHLLGHDHKKPKEAENMERLEAKILRSLGLPDPYVPAPEFSGPSLTVGEAR
jgi:probable rRNA maturation factor